MKPLFKTLFLSVFLLCCTVGCDSENEKEDIIIDYREIYMWANESSHTIRAELADYYSWGESRKYAFSLAPGETIRVPMEIPNGDWSDFEVRNLYFDERYVIDDRYLPRHMSIFEYAFYHWTAAYRSLVFTFTDTHYDYAVAHGTDLGEPKPTAEQAEITTTRTDRND